MKATEGQGRFDGICATYSLENGDVVRWWQYHFRVTGNPKGAEQNLGRRPARVARWRMAKPILDEASWAVLERLLPPDPPRPRGGRRRLPARQVLTVILFVLRSGIPWELLPRSPGLRLGHDLLAPAAGMARPGRLAAYPPRVAYLPS